MRVLDIVIGDNNAEKKKKFPDRVSEDCTHFFETIEEMNKFMERKKSRGQKVVKLAALRQEAVRNSLL